MVRKKKVWENDVVVAGCDKKGQSDFGEDDYSINSLDVFLGIIDPGVGVGDDGADGQGPARDDDGPDLPRLDPPRVDEEQLEVAAFAQHPCVGREHEVVLHHMEGSTPRLQRSSKQNEE